jgi:hypothetical protein
MAEGGRGGEQGKGDESGEPAHEATLPDKGRRRNALTFAAIPLDARLRLQAFGPLAFRPRQLAGAFRPS